MSALTQSESSSVQRCPARITLAPADQFGRAGDSRAEMSGQTYLQQTLSQVAASEALRPFANRWRRGPSTIRATCPDASNACFIVGISKRFATSVIVVAPNPDYAQRMADQIEVWISDDPQTQVVLFAESEGVPLERYEPDRNAAQMRIAAVDKVANPPEGVSRSIVVASIHAAVERTLQPEVFNTASETLNVGDRIDLNGTVRRWASAGYAMEPAVDYPGAMSRRGGIIDIFPVGADAPLRIELFDDEIESVRVFDTQTQRSVSSVNSVRVPPASETLPKLVNLDLIQSLTERLNTDWQDLQQAPVERMHEDLSLLATGDLAEGLTFYGGFLKHGTVFDYMPEGSVAVTCRPAMVREAAAGLDRRLEQVRSLKERRGEIPRNFPLSQMTWNDALYGIESMQRRAELSPFGIDADDLGDSQPLPATPIFMPESFSMQDDRDDEADPVSTDQPVERIGDALASGSANVIAISRHTARLRELLLSADIPSAFNSETLVSHAVRVIILNGFAPEGFSLEFDDGKRVAVITDRELFGVTKVRAQSRRRAVRRQTQLDNLTPGTFVVHEDHGIAKFLKVEPRKRDPREHLVLEFARGDRIYLPTEHIDRIQLYQGGGDQAPRLSRLGTQEWNTTRQRAKRAAELVAGELIDLYARRMLLQGIASDPDTPWQQNLEDSFQFVETRDQLEAVDAVKSDMESGNSMDRIICGDVGFGKTEVAVRAAFKAVQSGRQVAVLVPTTLLAQQHTQTFRDRLGPYPVTIDTLSRFKSPQEQRRAVERLADGTLDIVIGTHRLIQRDVQFKNLGLAIIDEEQKFGVQHKEHLKQLRAQVDVLTLSATPIPRTLYMSLAGIRDMSNIATPPEERRPVRTFVSERSDSLIREAILRELDRGGQAFFLHNRVKSIERIHRRLRKLVPEAKFLVGHGQMHENDLEHVVSSFDSREADVLICTTIVEAGIDMPNVNTLIVDNADKFGLAQLHHIRGRVGRSARQAFAYLLIEPHKSLTEAADARLNTILAASDLGAGYKIAMRDLEIRGMGNVIGAEQHGHVAAVGLHMYTKLLSQAVERLKAIRLQQSRNGRPDTPEGVMDVEESVAAALEDPVRVDVYLSLDDRIPREYIEDLAQRLAVYQRVAWARSRRDLDSIRSELRDRYGPVPRNFEYTVAAARIRLLARAAGVVAVRVTGDRATLTLDAPVGDAKPILQRTLGPNASVGNTQIRISIDQDDDPEEWIDEIEATLELIEGFKQRVMALVGG